MNDAFFYYAFNFNTICLKKYHYTDNRAGAPSNYLAYLQEGHCRIVSEQITLELQAGDVFFIPKGLSYQSYWSSEQEIRFISLGFHLFPEEKRKHYLLQKIDCDAETAQRVQSIPTNTVVDSRLLGDFYTLLADLLPRMRYDLSNPKKDLIEKAKKYIHANPDCKVADIAQHCLLSESALFALFKSEANTTPNGMRQQILCEKATVLLTTTDRSVQEISNELGFSSTSYFRKVLAKTMGQSPRQIRKNSLLT